MRKTVLSTVLIAGIALVAAGCNNGTSITPVSGQVYQQIERLSRPAVKEATEMFVNHDATNRSAPTNDALLQQSIVNFTETVAGRSPQWANALASILIPDEMKADLSVTVSGCGTPNAPCAAYLGVESGGATGNKFGGRWLNDDAIDIDLGALFGNTLSALGVVPDDGHESPCLTTDNVGPAQTYRNTFPYVNAPY